MPQVKRRSISYRSFVTCDDPKGIVECGAIRKSKINSQKKEQQLNDMVIEGEKKQENQSKDTSLAVNKEDKKEMGRIRGITGELETTPAASFQLQSVSKGADKLNHVINSWSSDNRKGGHQKDITTSLLRGALDLQESLVMLGKLQEQASGLMSGSRRKQKQKVKEGTFDGMLSGVNVMGSNRFEYLKDEKLQNVGFQRPRKSSDGVKKAVRESLLRQTVITNPIFEEHFDHRKLGSPDMPSTSSSQSSSMVHSSNFAPSDSSTSSTASQRRKRKDLNLVVKLMGLESPPSSPRKQREGDKILNLLKPMYEIDSPRARSPQYGALGLGKKHRTIDEILETLNFKGLLKNSSVNGLAPDSPGSEDFPLKYRWIDERPPIVVMKPLRLSCRDEEEPIMPRFRGETVMKQACNSRGSVQEIVRNEASNFSDKYKVAGVGCDKGGNFIRKGAFPSAKASINPDLKPQRRQAASRKAGEVEKVTDIRRKGEEKIDAYPSDVSRSRDQVKLSTSKIKMQKDGRFISKHQSSCQQKITSPFILDHRKQETCQLPFIGSHRCNDKLKDREAVYGEEIASISDNDSVQPTVDNMIVGNFHDKNWPEACQTQIRDYDVDNQSSISEIREGIEHHQNDKIPLCGIAALVGAHKECNGHDDNHSSYSEVTSVSTSEHSNFDQFDENLIPVCEVTLATTHENGVATHLGGISIRHKNGTRSSKEPDYGMSRQCPSPKTKLKALLLSNSLFVNHLEEVFDLQVHPDMVPCMNHENDRDVGSTSVLIDYANELVQLKSTQISQAFLPRTWMYTTKPRSLLSLDRLLDEVCDGIDDLGHYHSPASDDNFSSDNLYVILDRDLSFGSGIWEFGWKRTFSEEQVEQVIGEVDHYILDKVIHEVLSEFMA